MKPQGPQNIGVQFGVHAVRGGEAYHMDLVHNQLILMVRTVGVEPTWLLTAGT